MRLKVRPCCRSSASNDPSFARPPFQAPPGSLPLLLAFLSSHICDSMRPMVSQSIRVLRLFFAALTILFAIASLHAQKQQREPLNSAQIEKIREAGIYPSDRIKLYTQ